VRRLRLRPRARQDIEQIWSYSLDNFGEQRAIEYIEAVRAAFKLVQRNPGIARTAEGGRPNLMKFRVGSHILYFHITDQSIDVVRILHGRMDFPRHL
jgi:toxin ParE1/3/4